MTGPAAARVMETRFRSRDLLVSFGHVRPGQLALHNYPDSCATLTAERGSGSEQRIDLAAVDIVRDRERGMPRYNDFRRMLRLPPSRLRRAHRGRRGARGRDRGASTATSSASTS